MAVRAGRTERARRRIRRVVLEAGDDVRRHREAAGLSIRECSAQTGISASAWSRIERGTSTTLDLERFAVVADAVGLDASLRLFPTGAPLRDAGHAALLERFRRELHPTLSWRTEVPLGLERDIRAWDAVIRRGSEWVPVEAETRLDDLQALERRINLKLRDGGAEFVILLVAESRTNRAVLKAASAAWSSAYPIGTRSALRSLRAGELPAGNALIVL
ncbi:MAG TPA: helix-turn-helix transcriptional regulator [Candidatus Limnocylindrales bacterium]|nr:helix-turn-helix transcriptional regulator [Candidatus Limnocylindrales bacterium]